MNKKDQDRGNKWTSRIPKHLSEEERKKWEKDLEWEAQERERREKEGQYPSEESSGSRRVVLDKKTLKKKRH